MKGLDTKHVTAFRANKLNQGEEIITHLEGWIGDMMGSGDKAQHNGQFILTNQRICFYRKGILGEVFETIPLGKISSVETKSMMGHRVLRCHTSNDELSFKTFEQKDDFDRFYASLEDHRNPSEKSPAPTQHAGINLMDELTKLAKMRQDGFLSEEEFVAFKLKLLSN